MDPLKTTYFAQMWKKNIITAKNPPEHLSPIFTRDSFTPIPLLFLGS